MNDEGNAQDWGFLTSRHRGAVDLGFAHLEEAGHASKFFYFFEIFFYYAGLRSSEIDAISRCREWKLICSERCQLLVE